MKLLTTWCDKCGAAYDTDPFRSPAQDNIYGSYDLCDLCLAEYWRLIEDFRKTFVGRETKYHAVRVADEATS